MAAATESSPAMELDPKYDNYDFPVVSPTATSGHPGHLSSQQQAQVHQLRMLLESQGYTQRLDTLTLVRCPLLPRRHPFLRPAVGWAPRADQS